MMPPAETRNSDIAPLAKSEGGGMPSSSFDEGHCPRSSRNVSTRIFVTFNVSNAWVMHAACMYIQRFISACQAKAARTTTIAAATAALPDFMTGHSNVFITTHGSGAGLSTCSGGLQRSGDKMLRL